VLKSSNASENTVAHAGLHILAEEFGGMSKVLRTRICRLQGELKDGSMRNANDSSSSARGSCTTNAHHSPDRNRDKTVYMVLNVRMVYALASETSPVSHNRLSLGTGPLSYRA
jgi:hypothetical protein